MRHRTCLQIPPRLNFFLSPHLSTSNPTNMAGQQLLPPDLEVRASILRKKLIEPISKPDRAPVGLDTELEKSCKAPNIWLDAGFKAWYAWFCLDSNTRTDLATLPEPDLQKIAHCIQYTTSHETVDSLFRHLFEVSSRKRHRLSECSKWFYIDILLNIDRMARQTHFCSSKQRSCYY